MTASPDDAAASSSPPRAGGGAAAPSFSGTTGPRLPEDSPMPQQTPAHDETVRMRGDGPDGRPSPDTSRATPGGSLSDEAQIHDTRPVTRDWLMGAPTPSGTRIPPRSRT